MTVNDSDGDTGGGVTWQQLALTDYQKKNPKKSLTFVYFRAQ